MYKLLNIDKFEMTRNLKLKNLHTNEVLTVFDDTDITGHDEFKFMKVGHEYRCQISIYAKTKEKENLYDVNGKYYKVLGYETIAGYKWIKVKDEREQLFYIDHTLEKYIEKDMIYLLPLRYNILEVNGVERTYDLEDVEK